MTTTITMPRPPPPAPLLSPRDVQAHGDELTRGWVPLLRLLEAVPRAGQEPPLVTLGWQCVELLCSDFIVSLPKENIPKVLEVVAQFAQQVSRYELCCVAWCRGVMHWW